MIQNKIKPFTLLKLPYKQDALAPVISAETVSYHYNKHHQAYLDRLNELVLGTELEVLELEDVIARTFGHAEKAEIFNNAAQVWNHDFYWKSLSPKGGGKPAGELGWKIKSSFGSFENFLKEFTEAGLAHFGSGWIWLVEDRGTLKITQTSNAENPRSQGQGKALLTLDVWEHAYYLNYQSRRIDYLKAVLDKLVNWHFAEMNFTSTHNGLI